MSNDIDEEKINQILEELDEKENTKIEQEEQDVQELINTNIDDALKLGFPATILICGSTKTGKSELMKNIIYKNYKQFNRIFLLCPFAKNEFYNFIPDKYKIEDPSDADLTLIYNDCQNNPNISTLIIADDCISKINFERGVASKIITATGRHINLSLIIVMQYLNNISPIV